MAREGVVTESESPIRTGIDWCPPQPEFSMPHSPDEFASGLSLKLATRSRHVCALVGAGAGKACGLPDVAQLQSIVEGGLAGDEKTKFKAMLTGRTLEQALSRLRRIAALVEGTDSVGGLTAAQAESLDLAICSAVVKALDLGSAELAPMRDFAYWAVGADYNRPVELFTVNYDLLLETALEEVRALYFDGFVGSVEGRFQTELVEQSFGSKDATLPSSFVRLWKLHGSVNWTWRDDPREVVRAPSLVGLPAAIYPSDTKYDESRRVPFVVLMDRFRRALAEPETILLISGYSFNDDHLNEMIFDAATRHQRSEYLVFNYGDIPAALASKALTTPSLTAVGATEAIIGGRREPWENPDELPGIWESGKFLLGDFAKLATFLARKARQVGTLDVTA